MLQSVESQRVGHNLVTEQQHSPGCETWKGTSITDSKHTHTHNNLKTNLERVMIVRSLTISKLLNVQDLK